jgi:hypothetical protein
LVAFTAIQQQPVRFDDRFDTKFNTTAAHPLTFSQTCPGQRRIRGPVASHNVACCIGDNDLTAFYRFYQAKA